MIALDASESLVRLGFFLGAFTVFAVLEACFPRRRRLHPRRARWPNNIGISILNQAVVRVLLPATATVVALHRSETGSGLLNQAELPASIHIVAGILVLDLAIYLQHRLFHMMPVLWRFHLMHHADTDFDTSTGIRFHPVSIVVSAWIKLAAVYVFGPPAAAVLLFEVLLNATSMFNHSNIAVPVAIDRLLRLCVVTPDMHRVHHSVVTGETNSNFGFNFPWWDRLFGTYRAQPAAQHATMEIGLQEFRDSEEVRIDRMLTQPFRSQ